MAQTIGMRLNMNLIQQTQKLGTLFEAYSAEHKQQCAGRHNATLGCGPNYTLIDLKILGIVSIK